MRCYATARGEQGAKQAGVRLDTLKALPFSVSLDQAEQAFTKHQTSNIFLAQAQSWEKVKESFMPFWLVRMEVQATATAAQVGHRVLRSVGSGKDRRTHWEVHWQSARAQYGVLRYYPAEDPNMQVFASSKYSRRDMNRLAPGPLVAASLPITTPGVLDSAARGQQAGGEALRRVVPFTMSAADARAYVMAHVRHVEEAAAAEFYKSLFQADEARVADLHIDVLSVATYPLYVPTYVFSRYHTRAASLASTAASLLGVREAARVKIHTFVSGLSPGVVAGTRVYDETRVAAAAMLAGTALLWAAGAGATLGLGGVLLAGGALPAFLAMAVARYLPELRASLASMQQPGSGAAFLRGVRMAMGLPAGEEARPGAGAGGETLEDEWVRSYSAREARDEYAHQQAEAGARGRRSSFRQQQQRARMQGGGAAPGGTASSTDPKGYYALLGVSPGASTEDIQAAFRAAALKHHPDRPGGSKEAFQRLQEAYGVLRDHHRRAEYDGGGG